jgi:Cu-processing system permease protein
MSTVTAADVADERASGTESVEPRLVGVVARKVLREATRDHWFWLYCGGFAVLAGAITTVAVPDQGVVGSSGFGRTAASLVALVVTLMALTLGARSLAVERETGTLRFLLSHPVNRTEVLLGTYLGFATALLAAVAAGFGAAGLLSALRPAPADGVLLVKLAALSWLMALAMLGVGMVLGVVLRRVATAMGAALFVWLLLVFLGDLGIMGTVVATNLPVETLFASVMINPVESFRVAAIIALDGSLDALGPAGTYAVDTYGDSVGPMAVAVLVAWVIIPVLVAWLVFRRRIDL